MPREANWFESVSVSVVGGIVRDCWVEQHMRFDTDALPLGSVQRARAQLATLDPHKALTTCRQGKIPIESLAAEFRECIERLCKQKSFGVVLSASLRSGPVCRGPASITYCGRCLKFATTSASSSSHIASTLTRE